ncbi:sensor domain-containing diguanylate cyclase [Enterovirga rhinocerotis]|uniref:PAS domain S-box-containing protein/diguanylate cyclase (GGDEF)-like protein n=1 Tax=Enterovirga rhinocerotis TaxID=1339210 RepID=A0A4R7C7G8_9HYPH|nr:sensor domain-containing diguanylate cyclase [Enterovirga rhinocerotis]TDR94093.1 PAS domain S-box-containing protein/diguanylate cyclase (GGDEF)-like protein [Enterovirga rhinocerotis]
MSEFDAAPDSTSTIRAGELWLGRQASVDWRSSGLPDFDDWDQAIAVVARLVSCSSAPMALMMGPRGVLFANEAAQNLFAENAGPVNGRSVLDLLPDIAPFYAAVLEQARRGTSLSFQKRPIRLARRGQERTHWFNLDFTPVCDRDGGVAAVLGTASNVTTLVGRIRELSESEQRLQLALEGSGMVGIWTLDVPTRTSTADAQVARMYGLPVEACAEGVDVGRFLGAIHPDDQGRVRAALAEAIASGVPYRSRYRLLDDSGELRWVITSAKPVLAEDGTVGRLLGVVVEVTGQMETASALAESRFQFQTLTEALPQIVWSCDAEGRHDYFSARWSEFTGIEPADIVEETWKELVDPDHWEVVSAVWSNALETGESYDIDYRFRHSSGEYRWLRVMALPIRDEDGTITRWFGTSTDVHDAYLLAEEREALAQEFERIATEDQLTGALTRRAFLERANRSLAPGARTKGSFGLLMLDIDHFKSINDGYGHPVGDKVLAAIAGRIGKAVRNQDFIGRLGGEEFAVFLPHCARAQASRIAERIRRTVEEHPVALEDGRRIPITLSIGATCAPLGAAPLEDLMSAADRALYEAKAGGRNRTLFSGA